MCQARANDLLKEVSAGIHFKQLRILREKFAIAATEAKALTSGQVCCQLASTA